MATRRPMLIAALVALAMLAAGVPSPASAVVLAPRIVGGSPSPIEATPWQVYINDAGVGCGGSLIASTWVLTAAHCIRTPDPSQYLVWSGITSVSQTASTAVMPVSAVVVHPDYSATSFTNDVALLQLASPWTPTPQRQAVTLPVAQDPATWPAQGTPATISGWGYTSFGGSGSDQLMRATVRVLSAPGATCGLYGSGFVPSVHVCAGEESGAIDTCQGDSGGPLVVDVGGVPVLAGVTSVGKDCAVKDFPGIYTRVTAMIPWIRQVAGIPVTPPLPPTQVTATAIAGARAVVSWAASTNTGGAQVTAYSVTSSPDGRGCSAPETTCAVEGLVPGQTYTFTVQASNAVGTSEASAPSAPIVAVAGTSRVGKTVRTKALLRWAGVSAKARPTLTVLTKARCVVVPEGVRIRKAGVCKVVVRGGSRSGTAVIGSTS